jgi:hypothetical protein
VGDGGQIEDETGRDRKPTEVDILYRHVAGGKVNPVPPRMDWSDRLGGKAEGVFSGDGDGNREGGVILAPEDKFRLLRA